MKNRIKPPNSVALDRGLIGSPFTFHFGSDFYTEGLHDSLSAD
jgi:hypothetical protein